MALDTYMVPVASGRICSKNHFNISTQHCALTAQVQGRTTACICSSLETKRRLFAAGADELNEEKPAHI